MPIVKALDLLRRFKEGQQRGAEYWECIATTPAAREGMYSGSNTAARNAELCKDKAATLDRIAKVVEAAQAWAEAGTLIGIATGNEADIRLSDAVAALDAEEGQTAAPQEEGERP